MDNREETQLKQEEESREQQKEQHDEFLKKIEEILLTKAEEGYKDQYVNEEDETEHEALNPLEVADQDTVEEQNELFHEEVTTIEETLLTKVEEGYEDQNVIGVFNFEKEALNQIELADQDSLEEQKELTSEELIKIEETLLEKAKEGYEDQIVIWDDKNNTVPLNSTQFIEQEIFKAELEQHDSERSKVEEFLLEKSQQNNKNQKIISSSEIDEESNEPLQLKEQEKDEQLKVKLVEKGQETSNVVRIQRGDFENGQNQQTIVEKSAQSSDNKSIFHHVENTEEQTTQNQKFNGTDKSVHVPTTQLSEKLAHQDSGTIVENQKDKKLYQIKARVGHADGELIKLEEVHHKQILSSKSVERREQSHSRTSRFLEQVISETQVKPESITKKERNIKQNTLETYERINLLISETMEAGFNSLKTGKMSYINSFINHWNQIVELGKPPTEKMIGLYNEIKEKHGVSLYVINYKTDPGYKIRNLNNLPSIVDEWFTRKYTTYFNEWLIFRGHLEGESTFIKVWVNGSKNREKELFLIPNYEATKWNANGVPMELWIPKRSFILRSGLFTEVKFPPRYKYDPNRKNSVLIRHPVKECIINYLKNVADDNGKPMYKYPKEVSRQSWFNSAYQLKFDGNLIDEYLEGIYWQRIKTGRTRAERSSLKLSVINYYESLGERITALSDNIIDFKLNEIFEIYLVNESKALGSIISLFNDILPLKTVATFDEWIDKLKTLSGSEIARIIQKAKLRNLNKVPITFKLNDADKYQGEGMLTRDPIRFWVEKYTDGISGFAKALVGDNRVRNAIKDFSRTNGISQLDLPLNVTIETNWAHNPTRVNVVTWPDIVVKVKKGRKFLATEIVQNKILREISDNNGQISPRNYFLDYLKTMGEYDSLNCSIKNIQLEFLPRGDSLGGRTDIANDTNVVILSYWGNDIPQMGRIPEVIQSIRMIRYLDKVENQEIIQQKVVNKLKQEKGALGFQRKMDENTSRVIREMTELTSADGEVFFFRDSFLELIRRYGMALVSNDYSLELEKKEGESETH